MSSLEFEHWRQFLQLSPPYGYRLEVMIAQFSAMWANAHTKKGKAKVRVKEFLLNFRPEKKKRAGNMFDRFKSFYESIGGE